MRPVYRCGGLALALVILAGCGQDGNGGAGQAQAALAKPPASGAAEPAVARLGALQVAPDELKALLAEVPAQTRAQLGENREALERWMRARLAEKALYEQASAQDWQQRPEVKTLIDAATRQIVLRTYLESVSTVPEDYPSDADLHDAYEANKAQLGVPALYRVGEVSEPIQGGNGFHLVKLTERRDPRLASLDEVRERLRASLRAQRQEQIAKAYLDGLVNNATLSIDGALLGKTLAELR